MFLVDKEIRSLCNANFKEIYDAACINEWGKESPYNNYGLANISSDDQIDSNSLELKLDSIFQFYGLNGRTIGVRNNVTGQSDEITLTDNEQYNFADYCTNIDNLEIIIPAGVNFLCQSREYIQMPINLIGIIFVRSSYARQWLNHITSQLIKTTFCGNITFEFMTENFNKPITIKLSDALIQLALEQITQLPEKPYYLASSRYQHQRNQLNHINN